MQTSLSPLPVKIRHTADGIATSYSCAIELTSNSFLEVYLDGEIQPTGWSYDVENKQVIFDVAPVEGVVINFLRQTPVSYEKGIAEKGIINPEVLDNQSVNLVAMIQEVEEKLDRVPILPVNTDLDSGSIFSEFERLEKNASISAEEALQAVTEIEDLREETINSMNGIVKSSKDSITAHTEIMSNKLEAESNTYIQEAKNWAEDAKVSASEASLNNLKNKITNCITEIPQDIKWEFANNVFKAKAGSKVYVPNGKNTDGSNRFDELVLSKDLTITSATATPYLICVRADGVMLFQREASRSVSGAGVTTKAGFAYDTELNLIRYYNVSGELQDVKHSLPICLVTGNSSNTIETVDQIFNGFSKIGGRMFALPGVKGLAPNGRNADGSLKNIEFTISQVALSDREVLTGDNRAFFYNYLTNTLEDKVYAEDNKTIAASGQYIYNPDTNNIYNSGGANSRWVLCGFYSAGDTGITSFEPKLPFRAVDQNDFNKFDEEVTTLDSQNVKLTGTQTVAGEKTFTSKIVRRGAFNTIGLNITNATDTNGKGEANNIAYYAGTTVYNRLMVTNKTANKNAYLDVMAKDDGTGVIQTAGSAAITVNFHNAAAVNVPTPTASDNSTKAATTAWVNTRLGGTDVTSTEIGYLDGVTSNIQTQLNGTVKTSGNQTVGGIKTYTSEIVSQKTGGCYYLKNASYNYTTNPSANQSQHIVWRDKNNKDLSYITQNIDTSGTAQMGVYAGTYKTDGTRVVGGISVYAKRDGSVYTFAPTPGASDNSTKIATTAWVNSRITSSINSNDYVIETYRSDTNWYRIYKSGWIEQGGTTGEIATGNSVTVTFLKAFNDANYTLLGMAQYGQNKLYRIAYQTKTTTSVLIRNTDTDYKTPAVNWVACGMKA